MGGAWKSDYAEKVRKVVKGGSMVELEKRLEDVKKAGWKVISPVREVGWHADRYQVLCEYDNRRREEKTHGTDS